MSGGALYHALSCGYPVPLITEILRNYRTILEEIAAYPENSLRILLRRGISVTLGAVEDDGKIRESQVLGEEWARKKINSA